MSTVVVATVLGVGLRVVVGVVLAVVITSVSLRLLGMRRGWGTALLAGVVGWGIAIAVALGVNRWDWGADGLVLHLVAIGILATMATAVALALPCSPAISRTTCPAMSPTSAAAGATWRARCCATWQSRVST